MLAKLELTDTDFARIAERCESLGIALLVTPFGVDDVRRLMVLRRWKAKPSPLVAVKIASTDLTNQPLISAALGTGLPLVLSTGASTEAEIRGAVELVREHDAGDRLVLLHCVSAYPAPLEALNLSAIGTLRRAFRVPVGLSDHSASVASGAWAVAAGACVLEKHFTLDRTRPGPDHAMSLAPNELADYIQQARAAESAVGNGRIGMHGCEGEVRRVARRSVVAAVSISAGTRIAADMLTLRRPGTGIPPGNLDGVIGKVACVAIPADTLLTWAMVR
jgi:N-acetylneuraminate synthase/N,N'-diacetyllegionaminate synthase